MSYQVIARKWRPQSFQQLIGQDHIAVTLLNALKNQRLPQALLFTGPRGTGKTSTARILAKSVRCPNAVEFVPCGECPSCEDIALSRSLDVIEIDGASNNGVDAIRELRETVGYMPSSGRHKVYIIDEVHMLSTSAFNALLKTLEEPPPHVIFVMATTEAQKIPNTILSRCQRFDFRRIPSRQIAGHLEKICTADGFITETEAVWLIARQADGSMRDSQSLLDQVITYCGGEVTLSKVVDVLGLTDRSLLLETLQAVVSRDSEKALDVIEKILRAGCDTKVFSQDLLEQIRNALMVRLCSKDPTRIVDLPDSEIQALATITQALGEEDLHFLFDMALKGVNDLLRSQDTRVVLEMLILRMAAAPRLVHLSHLMFAAQGMTAAVASSTPGSSTPPSSSSQSGSGPTSTADSTGSASMRTTSERSTVLISTVAEKQRPAGASIRDDLASPFNIAAAPNSAASDSAVHKATNTFRAAEQSASASSFATMNANSSTNAEKNPEKNQSDPWFRFVDEVKKSNGFLGAMLENTHMMEIEADKLTVGVPKKMSFLFDKLKDAENVRRIEQFLETIWNKTYKVEVRLADAKSADVATPKATLEKSESDKKKSVENAVESHPLVRSAQDVFKTQIKSIKERP